MNLIDFSLIDGIAMVTLNRPEKRNAINGAMVQALLQTLTTIAADERARVLLIRGQGDHFCAGADIGWMQTIAAGSYNENYDDAQFLADLMYSLYTFPKPTIVLAHGATVGGGLGLLAACDIAIAAKDASFGFAEVRIGIAPSVISPYVITALGERAAHYYFLTGERFGADVAYQLGLIHQVTENKALESVGIALAKTMLKGSPKALTAVKQLIRYVAKEKITEGLAQKTAEHLAQLRASPEAQEGLRAFIEKREPQWG
ncbi:enoyl-CoA hydratase-related protein [Aquicella lusitana]|uniref:Methylglutaconyl-CoA hydratase n=1 Tax=Aquicella lusitana TaxID=254246 RepID=A0A370GK44_9COXI|nr:enoyl-CoA hydratase-related protein [Aquicella lusitana]RDI43740.1 methylglutaconyl-CoA hydratase [Aquicella lusitana]VVC74529.1 Hydroxycinnamoyl-CoA hydratase-lyase [Aquicella lusitana]